MISPSSPPNIMTGDTFDTQNEEEEGEENLKIKVIDKIIINI